MRLFVLNLAKCFRRNPETRSQPKFREKISEIGAVLRGQVVNRLQTDDGWRVSWAKDPSATPLTEDGAVPNSPEESIEACRRKNRWCCGVTLQMIYQHSGLGAA